MSTTSHHRHSSTTVSPSATSSSSESQASSNSSTTTTVIAAVAASVAGIILIFLLVRFIRHRLKRNESAPLPPVQPIAHHREQQLAQFEEQKFFNGNGSAYGSGTSSRTSTWYGGQHLMAPQQQFPFSPSSGGSLSDAPLLQHTAANNNKESDAMYADGSVDHEVSVMMDEKPLSPPSPPFMGLPVTANNNAGAPESDIGVPGSLEDPLPAIPPNLVNASRNASPSPSLRPNFTPSPSPSPNPGTYPTSLPHLRHPRTRPSSMHSTTSRKSTASNLNIIRGAPHGPHSSVQIVLPAPLAPVFGVGVGGDGYTYARGSGDWGEGREGSVRSRSRTDSHSRLSMVDRWAGLPGGAGAGGNSGKGERESGRENGRGREKERRTLKKVDRKASSVSAGAGPRTSMSSAHTTYSSSSHQPNSHSLSHLHYPHPFAHPPSKSPLFRSHSPNVNPSSSTSSLSNSSPSPPHSTNQHSPSPPPPAGPSQLRASLSLSSSSSVPPRDHSGTPPPQRPPVPRIPSMYSNYNNNSNSNLDTIGQSAPGSGAGAGVGEVERGRRLTPAAGFGSRFELESPAPSRDAAALVPGTITATPSTSTLGDGGVQA